MRPKCYYKIYFGLQLKLEIILLSYFVNEASKSPRNSCIWKPNSVPTKLLQQTKVILFKVECVGRKKVGFLLRYCHCNFGVEFIKDVVTDSVITKKGPFNS